jgi:sec-independent protein translocase protein TatA
MLGLGPTELIVIGVLAVLLFGNRLPGIAKSLGRSITEFKKGVNDISDDANKEIGNGKKE